MRRLCIGDDPRSTSDACDCRVLEGRNGVLVTLVGVPWVTSLGFLFFITSGTRIGSRMRSIELHVLTGRLGGGITNAGRGERG